MKRPSFQFYPGDWLRSPRLRLLSLAAKGLWIDMLCVMHSAEPYGHLAINGKALDEEALGRLLGASPKQISVLLRDLEEVGVFSRTEDGVIYSRRMVNDEAVRERRARGGVKSLDNPNVPRRKDVPKDTLEDTLQGRLEGIDGRRSPSSSSSSSSSGDTPKPPGLRLARPLSEPFGFADWFVGEAIALSLVGPLDDAARDLRVKADLRAAGELLGSGVAECQQRARRYLAALASGKLDRSKPTVRGLRAAWEMAIVARDPLPDRRAVRAGSYDDVPVTVMPK